MNAINWLLSNLGTILGYIFFIGLLGAIAINIYLGVKYEGKATPFKDRERRQYRRSDNMDDLDFD